jgi:hypothetical protein
MVEQEKLHEALAIIETGLIQPTKIAAALGMPYRTYADWMLRSNRGDERFLIEVNGATVQWAAAIVQARRLAMLELRGMLETYSIFGEEVINYEKGQVVWAIDPVAAAMSVEDRTALGFREDALLEINGALQPVKRLERAPIQLQLRLLEATFRDMRPQSVQEVNVNGNVAIGIGYAGRADFSKGPPAIPAEPDMPQLEVLGDVERIDDPELEAMLGLDPVPVSINIEVVVPEPDETPVEEPEPDAPSSETARPEERMIRDTPTAAETPPPQTGPLAPRTATGKTVPLGWRDDWARLQARAAALPGTLNRKG